MSMTEHLADDFLRIAEYVKREKDGLNFIGKLNQNCGGIHHRQEFLLHLVGVRGITMKEMLVGLFLYSNTN